MTNEETIALIQSDICLGCDYEYDVNNYECKRCHFGAAIAALKAEPCEDAVRRETVRDMFCEIHCHNERSKCAFRNICKYMNHVSALPPVTPLPDKIDGMLEDAYEHGYQQARYDYEAEHCGDCDKWETDKTACQKCGETCDDAVKREAVLNTLDTMDKALDEDRTVEHYKGLLAECYKALPPVTPKSRMEGESE